MKKKKIDEEIKKHIKQVGTVIPPVMINEPKEVSSDNIMSEIIGEYANVIAKHVAESPNGTIRLTSAVNLLAWLKYLLDMKITNVSDYFTVINPIEFSSNSLCETFFSKSELIIEIQDTLIEDKNVSFLLKKAHINLDLEDERQKQMADRMKGLLNMRRCYEERAAYKHLINISILEKIVGIVTGEGTVYSQHLKNAAGWYTKVAIRNRICDIIDVMSPENAEFVPELTQQVIRSLNWFLQFNIKDKCLLDRNFIGSTKFEALPFHSLYSPGTRHAFFMNFKSKVLPVVATRLPPMTSMIREVRIGDSFFLSINNYSTGNLFIFSTNGMRTIYKKPMINDNKYSMFYMAPSHQITLDQNITFVQHWNDCEMNKTSFSRVIQQKRNGDEEKVIKNGSIIFTCNYKKIWKNLLLFEQYQHIGYKFATNSKAKIMLSLTEQFALNNTLEGKSLLEYKKAVEKYITNGENKSLTRIDLVVFCTDSGEELCRCEGLNDCMFRYKNDTIKSVVDVYEVKTMKNKGKLKKFISTTTAAAVPDALSSKKKSVDKVLDGPADDVHSTNMIPFMSKMYIVLKVNQKIREKCIVKKMELEKKK